ncbi:hypothetical protein PanWU01x14_339480 [Parasponia andersonii]|uniref:Uncharacterized protein n=1 Tax=Parasponia andersonii TaxID=3476 RepID=A0A2P5AEQ5_PARAD|nr:hypothetical protein PanWU01x14_339480 [Parasponia andersonii]
MLGDQGKVSKSKDTVQDLPSTNVRRPPVINGRARQPTTRQKLSFPPHNMHNLITTIHNTQMVESRGEADICQSPISYPCAMSMSRFLSRGT